MTPEHPGSENEPKTDERIAALEADNAALEADNAALKAQLPALGKERQQWEAMFQATLETLRRAPEIGELRQEGMRVVYAKLATRVRAIEVASLEAWDLIMSRQGEQDELLAKVQARQIELYEMVQKLLARLEGLGEK